MMWLTSFEFLETSDSALLVEVLSEDSLAACAEHAAPSGAASGCSELPASVATRICYASCLLAKYQSLLT